ncbi:hypothetical protein JG687_00010853 [Phytophthora cactorum]|uniref:Uncharacterized protein n=1 Tax=Phytophthora cactorum TaxID=29920 RepID=A0A8T1U5S4_9STRA|nr:hypothetical protein JG687_00010853 [Phytophthora cactorum]
MKVKIPKTPNYSLHCSKASRIKSKRLPTCTLGCVETQLDCSTSFFNLQAQKQDDNQDGCPSSASR